MKKRLSVLIGTAALAVTVGLFAATGAFAQTTTPQATTPQAQSAPAAPGMPAPGIGANPLRDDGPGFGFFGGSTAVFDAEAQALKLTPAQLFEQLHSGKTLSEIAQAQGVDIATVQAAAQTAETQAMKDNISQAVANGTITQAQADWLLQGLNAGYLNDLHGFGFDGDHGRGPGGRFGAPGAGTNGTPATPASPSTSSQS